MAPPALPPETADPIKAPVPAPIAPPASVPVCCCCVWQADSVEVIFVRDRAAVVDLNFNEVGVDSIDGGAEGFEKHGGMVRGVYQTRLLGSSDGWTVARRSNQGIGQTHRRLAS